MYLQPNLTADAVSVISQKNFSPVFVRRLMGLKYWLCLRCAAGSDAPGAAAEPGAAGAHQLAGRAAAGARDEGHRDAVR